MTSAAPESASTGRARGGRALRERVLLAVLAASAGGCLSPVALDRAVIAYDRTAVEIVSKQLLLNIARARHHKPIHFTAVSNIAATYDFRFNAGVTPALTGASGSLLAPLFGGSVAESPTVSITPMGGDEFTRRLLTPFEEGKLSMLLRQGYDVDALLRLLAGELRVRADGGDTVYYNRPSDRNGYPVFRRVMAHLSSIQDRHALHVEPVRTVRHWTMPASALTAEGFQAIATDGSLSYDPAQQLYHVSRRVTGRTVIANYDAAALADEERIRLQEAAAEGPVNEILVDIRPGYPGGEYAIHGRLRLRSFHTVLTFVGRDIAEEPEYDVTPDPRTPTIGENPVHALQILESERAPAGVDLAVSLSGAYYTVAPEAGYQWNQKNFSLLYQLFQMTVAPVPPAAPAITIAK